MSTPKVTIETINAIAQRCHDEAIAEYQRQFAESTLLGWWRRTADAPEPKPLAFEQLQWAMDEVQRKANEPEPFVEFVHPREYERRLAAWEAKQAQAHDGRADGDERPLG
jgi:hypothetical protein